MALEETGYSGGPNNRESKILEDWSVKKAKQLGVNAVKLLVYYNPDSITASNIEALVRRVNEECAQYDLPFILEILTYSTEKNSEKLIGNNRRDVIIESARKLSLIGCDMLKLEFPIDFRNDPDHKSWVTACSELTAACSAPWVLLSASVDYPTYIDQVAIACDAGAIGIAAGRAVWKEAVMLQGIDRMEFLRGEASERLQRLSDLVSARSPKFDLVYETDNISYISY